MTEIEALRAAIAAAWDAYFCLTGREAQNAGRGRDGHLNADDLEVLRLALLKAQAVRLAEGGVIPPLRAAQVTLLGEVGEELPKPPPADKCWIGERQTGQEAFIPKLGISRQRGMALASQAAAWHGASVVPNDEMEDTDR